MRNPFQFKQFSLIDDRSAMKLSTDAVLLGAFASVANSRFVLDIGTGSGIVALIIAQRSPAEITGIDIHSGSLIDACANFSNSPWSERLSAVESSVQEYAVTSKRTFDLIVSNPPYFVNSLPSPSEHRAISKHANKLGFEALLASVDLLLDAAGIFCLILPVQESRIFEDLANRSKLYVQRKCLIHPKRSKPANRVLLEFNRSETANPEITTLTIRKEDDSYTEAYMNYTRELYLHF